MAEQPRSRRPIVIGIGVIIAIIILIILVFRVMDAPAQAQTQDVTDAQAAIIAATQVNLSRLLDTDVGTNIYGPVEDTAEVAAILASETEVTVVVTPEGAAELRRLDELVDADLLSSYQSELRGFMAARIAPGDLFLAVTVEDSWSHFVLSPDGSRVTGLLPMTVRLDESQIVLAAAPSQPPHRRENCERRGITYYVFGRVAEWVEGCAEASCEAGVPQRCELSRISSGRGLLARLNTDPTSGDTPITGDIFAAQCRGQFGYSWGTGLPALSFQGYGIDAIDIMGGTGTHRVTVTCD